MDDCYNVYNRNKGEKEHKMHLYAMHTQNTSQFVVAPLQNIVLCTKFVCACGTRVCFTDSFCVCVCFGLRICSPWVYLFEHTKNWKIDKDLSVTDILYVFFRCFIFMLFLLPSLVEVQYFVWPWWTVYSI